MRRTLALGWLLGMLTFGAGMLVGANWYEYRFVDRLDVAINEQGFEPVPGQADRFLVRRPRLRLP